MRFDPRLSREEIVQRLVRDAQEAWGEHRLAELRPVLEATGNAIHLVARERLEPTDVEP